MLSYQITVTLLFLLGIICLSATLVRFYSTNSNIYKPNSEKSLESSKITCDSCFAPTMQ